MDDDRDELHDRRIAEIGYAVLTGTAIVAVPAVAGHLLGWSSSPAYAAVLVVLGAFAVVRAVLLLVRLERRLAHRGAVDSPEPTAKSGS